MARYLTTAQACTVLACQPATIQLWARRGLLTRYSRAGQRVWRMDQLAAAQRANEAAQHANRRVA